MFQQSIKVSVGENWNATLNKLKTRAQSLSARNILIFGRATIANTVLLSKAWYVARIFTPPPDVLKSIKQVLMKYIWQGKHQSISNLNLFKPQNQGGIGLLPPLDQAHALQISDLFKIGEQDPPPLIYYARYWISFKVFRLSPDWNFLNTNAYPRNIQGKVPIHLDILLRKLKDCMQIKSKTAANIRRHLAPKFDMPSPLPKPLQDHRDHVKYRIDWKTIYQNNFDTIGYPKSAESYLMFIHNGLSSRSNVRNWHNNHPAFRNDICPKCPNATETTMHMFLCPWWIPVWQFMVETLKAVFKVPSLTKLLLRQIKAIQVQQLT